MVVIRAARAWLEQMSRRPLPLDVLPGLERQRVPAPPLLVDRRSHHAPGHPSEQRLGHRHIAAGRAAEGEREPQGLGIADGDVRPPLGLTLLDGQ